MSTDDIISIPYLVQGSNVLYPGNGITFHKPPVRVPEKFSEFADCQTREATFRRAQNISFFHDAACLADAGFYYCGSGNKVRCFHCGLGLQHLEKEDLLAMHVRLSPYCQHVHQNKDADIIAAIQITSPFFLRGNNETPEHVKEGVFVSTKHYLGEGAKAQRRESFELPETSANLISTFVDNGYFFCKEEQKACCAFCNNHEDLLPGTTPIIRHEAWCDYRGHTSGEMR